MPNDLTTPVAIVGNLNVDQWIGPIDRFPDWDEEIIVESSRLELAGTAGYLLRAAHGLGMTGFVVSTIGDDPYGALVLDELRRLGAETRGVEVLPGAETCLGMIFIGSEGQRAIIATLGAHAEMNLDVVCRHDDRIAACGDVFLCGMYLLPKLRAPDILPYAGTVSARGQQVFFDPSWDPAGWTPQTRKGTLALLAAVDVYLPNETELLHLTGAVDLDAALDQVCQLAGEVVVKRGANGALLASGSSRVSVPALPVTPVNTIGAGDVFDIGYLYARRLGWRPEERLRFACGLAGMVVAQAGIRQYPNADEVMVTMKEAGYATRLDA
jgi:sugar/nucleoside kinase (ribokinase family)